MNWCLPRGYGAAGLFGVFLGVFAMNPASAATDFQDIPYLQARVGQVLEMTPDGGEGRWFNEATGNSGVIRVLRTHTGSAETPCRDYERTTRRPGQSDAVVRGTGCRDASGRWRLKETEKGGPAAPAAAGTAGEPAGGQAGGQAGSQTGGQTGGQVGGQAAGQQGGGQQGGGQQGGGQQGGGQASQSGSWAPPEPQATAAPEPLYVPTVPEPTVSAAPAPTAKAPKPAADDFSIDMPTPSE